MTPRTRPVALILIAAAAALALAGCGPKVTTIDSAWPQANAERTVPKPPGPPRWPLTGIDAPDEAATLVRVVCVKIENSPAARPQLGLDKADLVYETVTEGGITRFNALFHSQVAPAVAPVRSARWSDTYIVPQYRALFAHCGGSPDVMAALKKAKNIDDMDQFYNPASYWRMPERSAPHDLALDVAKLREAATEKRGYDATMSVRPFTFDRTAAPTTASISAVTIPFSDANIASWVYDGATGKYMRSVNGKPHVDKGSGQQYAARNVVVMWAQVKNTLSQGTHGKPTLNIILNGSGRVTIFRNGTRFDGKWEAGAGSPPMFKGSDGEILRLSPGITWFQVIANNQNITMK